MGTDRSTIRRRLPPVLRRAGRELLSFLPLAGVVPRPANPFGVTAVMRVRDEEDWLEASVRSLAGFADQVVIGENGSEDGTPAIVDRLHREFPGWVEVAVCPADDIRTLTNRLIARARYRWVVRWDGDFVALTEGPRRIALLRDRLAAWRFRHCLMYLPMVELAGDLWHQDPASALRADAHLFTASDRLRYVYDRMGYESPFAPPWYAVRRESAPSLFHMHVKSDRRLFLNGLWKRYLIDREPDKKPFPEYVRAFCWDQFGHGDVDRSAAQWIALYAARLAPFDAAAYGDYPALLRPHLDRPKYRLRYQGGKIVGRDTLA